jgi:hypothetical protein
MSASEAPALDAIAFRLAAALEEYERDVARMVDTWLDMDLYRDVSEQVEEIRMFTAALPQLSVPWVELLIAHAELVHSLWRLRFQDVETDRERFGEVREHHTACIHSLRSRCVRLLSSPPPASLLRG